MKYTSSTALTEEISQNSPFEMSNLHNFFFQANIMYNIQKTLLKPKFSIDVKIFSANEKLTRRKSCRSQTLKVCTSYLGEGKKSNMAIIDVRMVSGFTADKEQFEDVRIPDD